MDNKKLLLLIASIFTLMYVGLNIILEITINSTASNNQSLNIFYIIFFSLLIIGSLFFLYLVITKKDMSRYRIPILLFSIIMFINNVIGGVLGFIVFFKTNKKKLRELPKLDNNMNNKWYIYLLSFILCIFIIFGVPYFNINRVFKYSTYLFMILLLLIVFYKDLKRDIKYFFKYFREYNAYVIKMYLFSLLSLLILTISIRLTVNVDNSTNQVTLMEQFKEMPLFISFLSIIYAPFVEEILFRGIIRKFITNKWFFIIISGLLFGVAHVIDDYKSVGELLYIFVYGSLGCFLAAIYHKTNNIFTNMYFHFIQNTLAVICILILNYLVH